MRRLALVGLVMGILLAPQAARAGGVYGPTGLFLHPTGYLPPDRRPTWGVTYFTQTRQTATGERTVDWVPVFVDQRLSDRFEGGLVFLHQRAFSRSLESYGGFAKYVFAHEREGRPALALAADHVSGDLRSTSAYLVASKEFRAGERPIRAHLGYVVTRRGDLQGPEGRFHETDHAPYAGIELFLTPQLRLTAEVEERMKFYRKAPTSVGLMWNPSPNVGLGIGWLNTGRSEDSRFFVGVGYKIKSVD